MGLTLCHPSSVAVPCSKNTTGQTPLMEDVNNHYKPWVFVLPPFGKECVGLLVCAGSERLSHLGLAVSLSFQEFWV